MHAKTHPQSPATRHGDEDDCPVMINYAQADEYGRLLELSDRVARLVQAYHRLAAYNLRAATVISGNGQGSAVLAAYHRGKAEVYQGAARRLRRMSRRPASENAPRLTGGKAPQTVCF